MTKMQYILFIAIIGFYSFLFVSLVWRALAAFARAYEKPMVPRIDKSSVSRVGLKARNRAWTRAVWRGSLATDAR
jgi:hypothetical protein